MKKIYVFLLLFIVVCSNAQVGIGTTTPDASAVLDITSTTQGVLPPRMTTTERDNIVSSANGLMIYNTTTSTLEYKTDSGWISYKDIPNGTSIGEMNYWNGTSWVAISPGANGEVLKFINNAPTWGMVEATVPDAPTIGTAVAGNGQATISFTAPAFNGYSTITSYTATSSPDNISVTISQSGDGTITVTGLTNGTSYTFTITATNTIGTSISSNVSEAVIPVNFVFDNLATTASGLDYGNKSKIGQQFLATGGGQLVQVEVNLFRTNSQSGAFTVELWSNNSNSTRPQSLLATLNSSDWSNMPLNSITPTYSITSFTQNYTLVAGTYYWLVVSQPANGPAAKRWAKNGSGLGQTAVYNNNNNTWTNLGSSENFGARIKTIN